MIGPFRHRGARWYLRHSWEPAIQGAQAVRPTREWLRALASDPAGRALERALRAELGTDRIAEGSVVAFLQRALEVGRLVLERVEEPLPHVDPPATEESSAGDQPTETSEKDWIEIELSDVDGNLIAGAEFELTLADGTKRTGSTDDRGRFYAGGIDPGSCKLTFTKLRPVEQAPKFASDTTESGG